MISVDVFRLIETYGLFGCEQVYRAGTVSPSCLVYRVYRAGTACPSCLEYRVYQGWHRVPGPVSGCLCEYSHCH